MGLSRARTYVNRAGSYLYEPPGSVHTLYVPADNLETTETLTVVYGQTEYLGPNGEIVAITNSASNLAAYFEACEASGVPGRQQSSADSPRGRLPARPTDHRPHRPDGPNGDRHRCGRSHRIDRGLDPCRGRRGNRARRAGPGPPGCGCGQVRQAGNDHLAIAADSCDEEDFRRVAHAVTERFGAIDGLMCLVGGVEAEEFGPCHSRDPNL